MAPLVLQLDRALTEDRDEATVSPEARLDLREAAKSPFLADGLRARGGVRGAGGRGILGGGPFGFDDDDAVVVISLPGPVLEDRCEAMLLVRLLEERRDGGTDEVSVAVVVCKLCASVSSSIKQLRCELDSCELPHVSSEANEVREAFSSCSVGRAFLGGMGKA